MISETLVKLLRNAQAQNAGISEYDIEEMRLWAGRTQSSNAQLSGILDVVGGVRGLTVPVMENIPLTDLDLDGNGALLEDVSSITFAVPGDYAHLLLFCYGRTDDSAGTAVAARMQFNGDTSSSYNSGYIWGHSATTVAAFEFADTFIQCGYFSQSLASTGSASGFVGFLTNYDSQTLWKMGLFLGAAQEYDTSLGALAFQHGFWHSTDPITSVTIYSALGGNILAGSTLALYGIRAK